MPVESTILASMSDVPGASLIKFDKFASMHHIVSVFGKRLKVDSFESLQEGAESLLTKYHACLHELGLDERQTADHLSFSMWLTPTMMFIVSRHCNSVPNPDDSSAVVDINTLGFVGTLAVKNQASLDFLKAQTPIHLLKQVAAPDRGM